MPNTTNEMSIFQRVADRDALLVQPKTLAYRHQRSPKSSRDWSFGSGCASSIERRDA